MPLLPSGRSLAAGVALFVVVVGSTSLVPGLGGTSSTAEAAVVAPPADWVDHLNQLRADYGSGPLRDDGALSAATQEHALYMAQHRTLAHDQQPGRARSSASGRAAAQRSLLAGPAGNGEDTPAEFVDLWSRGPFTALAMLHPALSRVGFGQAAVGGMDYAALDVRSGRVSSTVSGWPRAWPSARRPITVTTYAGSETPDPVRSCGSRPAAGWGLPLLVSYGPGQRPTGATASLSVDGRAVGVCVVAAAGNPDAAAVVRLDEAHSVVVVPREPLVPGSRYTGSVTSSRGTVALEFTVAAVGAVPSNRKPAAGATATSWQRVPGSARAVSVAPDGRTAWALGRTPVRGGFPVLRWTGTRWQAVPGAAVSLDVDRSGRPWIVTSAGAVHRRSGSSWQRLPGAARAIGVGGDGAAWVLGRRPVAGGWNLARWTGRSWAPVPGGAVSLDVDGAGRPWIVNSAGAILRRTGSSWQRLPGSARAVGVGGDGRAWVITRRPVAGGGAVARWTGTAWVTVPGGATDVDVDASGRSWIVTAGGGVHRRTGAS